MPSLVAVILCFGGTPDWPWLGSLVMFGLYFPNQTQRVDEQGSVFVSLF